jgi:hypothetical protein
VLYREDEDDSTSGKELAEKGYTLPEYHFVLQYKQIECTSPVLPVKGWEKKKLQDRTTGDILINRDYTLLFADGTEVSGQTDENGLIEQDNLPIGEYLILTGEDENADE